MKSALETTVMRLFDPSRRSEIPVEAGDIPKSQLQLQIGLVLLGIAAGAALFAPWLAVHDPYAIHPAEALLPPSAAHPFGCDAFGRDLFSRVLFGMRLSLGMSALAVVTAAVPGVLFGMAAGYLRGWTDQVCSRLVDVLLSLPGLLLPVVLIARLGASAWITAGALGLTGIPVFYRITRCETIGLSLMQYVEAAHALGASKKEILLRHILPNLSSSLITLVSARLAIFLLAGSGLSFIGLGARPPSPELGMLLAASRDTLSHAWWTGFFPGLAIVWLALGFQMVGDGLRNRHANQG